MRDHRDDRGVLEQQVPADHPADHLAEHRVAVGVRRPRPAPHCRVTTPVGIEVLSARADELAERWDLRLERAYPPGWGGLVFRARTADGDPAVLKVVRRSTARSRTSAAALQVLDGRGAVRVLRATDDGSGDAAGALRARAPAVRRRAARSRSTSWSTCCRGPGSRSAGPSTPWRSRPSSGGPSTWSTTGERAGCGYPRRLLDATVETAGLAGRLAGRAGAGEPGPARRQRAGRGAGAVADDRPDPAGAASASSRWPRSCGRPSSGTRRATSGTGSTGWSASSGWTPTATRGWALAQTVAWCPRTTGCCPATSRSPPGCWTAVGLASPHPFGRTRTESVASRAGATDFALRQPDDHHATADSRHVDGRWDVVKTFAAVSSPGRSWRPWASRWCRTAPRRTPPRTAPRWRHRRDRPDLGTLLQEVGTATRSTRSSARPARRARRRPRRSTTLPVPAGQLQGGRSPGGTRAPRHRLPGEPDRRRHRRHGRRDRGGQAGPSRDRAAAGLPRADHDRARQGQRRVPEGHADRHRLVQARRHPVPAQAEARASTPSPGTAAARGRRVGTRRNRQWGRFVQGYVVLNADYHFAPGFGAGPDVRAGRALAASSSCTSSATPSGWTTPVTARRSCTRP